MTRYSVQWRDWIFVKGYGFLSFTRNMRKIIGKIIRKNIGSKYSQKRLDHAKQSATDALKTASKRAIQKTTEATRNLIGNKITRVSRTWGTKNWGKISDESQGTYNVSNQIKFKTSMIRSNVCDYSDAYIHRNGI